MALPIANVAKYELTLPSQQKNIAYRPFLVKEEKILFHKLTLCFIKICPYCIQK